MNLETPPAELQELLDTIERTPMGNEELELVRTALARAQELDLPGWSYVLRLWFNRSTFRMGETDSLFSSFTQTLAIHDSDPQRFPLAIDEDTHLLFQYKWVAEMLNDSPAYSLAQIQGVYADMERRFRHAGASLSGFYQTRFAGACSRGEWDDAEQYFAELQVAPRDNLSHCEACYRSTAALYFADRGNTDHALELLEEIFSGQYVCGDEPEFSESQAMFMYLRKDDLDQAKYLHYKSLATIRQHPDPGSMLLRHVEFCILTGNTARALSLVEQYPRMFECSPLNVARQFESLTLLGLLANALSKDGRADVPILGTNASYFALLLAGTRPAPGTKLTDLTPAQITAQVWPRAQQIADAFNQRNGNEYYSQRLEQRRALLTTRIELPLGLEQYETDVQPLAQEPEPVTGREYLEAVSNALPHDPAKAVKLFRAAQTLEPHAEDQELIATMLGTNWEQDPQAGVISYEELAKAFARVGNETMAEVTLRFRERLSQSIPDGTAEALTELLDAAIAKDSQTAQYLAITAAEAYLAVDPAAALMILEADLMGQVLEQAQAGTGSTGLAVRTLLALSEANIRVGDSPQAAAALNQARLALFGVRSHVLRADVASALLAAREEQWEQAINTYDSAAHLALQGRDFASAWAILAMKGRTQATIDRSEDAARTLQRAVKYAAIAGAKEEQRHDLHFSLGTQLINAGLPQEALAPLRDALNWHLNAESDPQVIAMHLAAVGEAAARSGEIQEAFSAWIYGRDFSEEHALPQETFGFLSRIVGLLTEMEHPQVQEFTHDLYKAACELEEPALIAESAQRSAIAQSAVSQSEDYSILDKAVEYIAEHSLAQPEDLEVVRIEMALLRSQLLARNEHLDSALQHALRAVELAHAAGIEEAQSDAYTVAGLVAQQLNDIPSAREYFGAALTLSQGEDQEFLKARLNDLES